MPLIEWIKAVIFGIVEGITEWLPVSSTGHLILIDACMTLNVTQAFRDMFLVVIQVGAILAVPVLFFEQMNPFSRKKDATQKKSTWNMWGKVVVAMLPAALIGIPADDWMEEHLYRYYVVAFALILYGAVFILIEKRNKETHFHVETVEDLSYLDALKIGCFQVLSLVPGTSRSGSTILGGRLIGVSRNASAKFSFFMAVPVMVGASFIKIVKFISDGYTVTFEEFSLLLIACFVSFLLSVASIRFLMDFVKRHSFAAFGVYRIVLGLAVLLYFGCIV